MDASAESAGGEVMKTIFTISAILNLLIIALAFICTVIGAINKSDGFLAMSALTVVVSIFPATLMLSLCNEFKEAK